MKPSLGRSIDRRRSGLWPTTRTLNRLGERVQTSSEAVAKLIEERAVAVPDEHSPSIGWGQYLDEDHKSRRQWGRYGTSAAVRTLSACQRITATAGTAPPTVSRLHPALLPAELPPLDPTLKTDDFERIVKFAYILEGIGAAHVRVQEGSEPPLLSKLDDLHHRGRPGWSSRDGSDSYRDRRLATAVVLHALRRFPGLQSNDDRAIIAKAYAWLAREITRPGVQIDLVALAGIALVEAGPAIGNTTEVKEALPQIDQKLAAWVETQKRVSISRPYFIGFVEHDATNGKDSTDYVFLSPELLTARYLLKRDLPQTRRFVLRVVSALLDNIEASTANDMGGYTIQGTMIRTVDQAWAMDLLETFENARRDDAKRLLPPRTAWLTQFRVLAALYAVALIAVVVLVALTGQPAVVAIAPVLGLLLFGVSRNSRR